MVGDALFMNINNKRESYELFKCLNLPGDIRVGSIKKWHLN